MRGNGKRAEDLESKNLDMCPGATTYKHSLFFLFCSHLTFREPQLPCQ